MMISRILFAALLAGFLAGLFATAVQAWRVTPLILEAERYEADSEGLVAGHSHGETAGDEERAEPWAPADGFERVFYTGLANVGIGIAFAMLVTAAALLMNLALSPAIGLALGAAGFVSFVLAPNFGLPPELPGMQAADLGARQMWWAATVLMTAAALWIFTFRRSLIWMVGGIVLMLAPHLYGAPQPVSHESAVPANLAAEFATASIIASALFWLFLGGVLGWLVQRFTARQAQAANPMGRSA